MSKNARKKIEHFGNNRGTRILFIILLVLTAFFVLGLIETRVYGAQFNITLDSPVLEYEADLTALLVANCTDELGVSHGANVTFTVDGVAFTYSNYTGLYYGTVLKGTPTTIEYDSLGAFTDTENGTSSGQIIETVTITWTTGTLERLQTKFMSGNWIGAILDEEAYIVGTLTLYTFILGTISIAVWNVTGPYGTFMAWLLGWIVFAANIHGPAQSMALLLFALGCGLMFTKLYLDRRTT